MHTVRIRVIRMTELREIQEPIDHDHSSLEPRRKSLWPRRESKYVVDKTEKRTSTALKCIVGFCVITALAFAIFIGTVIGYYVVGDPDKVCPVPAQEPLAADVRRILFKEVNATSIREYLR